MSAHPRTLGRAWLDAIAPRVATTAEREAARTIAPAPTHAPTLCLVPTSDELRRQLGIVVHQLTREETDAWLAEDPELRAEARRAIREAVRERGGGELRDHRGRLIERT